MHYFSDDHYANTHLTKTIVARTQLNQCSGKLAPMLPTGASEVRSTISRNYLTQLQVKNRTTDSDVIPAVTGTISHILCLLLSLS